MKKQIALLTASVTISFSPIICPAQVTHLDSPNGGPPNAVNVGANGNVDIPMNLSIGRNLEAAYLLLRPQSTEVGGGFRLLSNGSFPVWFVEPRSGQLMFSSATSGNPNLALNPNGNVGIGTSNPEANLHVQGKQVIRQALGTSTWDGPAQQRIYGLDSFLDLGVFDSSSAFLQSHRYNVGHQPLALNPAGGNVGIGTDNPQAKLDVNGDVRIGGTTLSYSGVGRIASGAEITLQSAENNPIYLNPFHGGDVVVGSFAGDRTLRVVGKVVSTTLELTSDRNQKQDFQPIAARYVAEKVAALPVTTWVYTNSPTVRHIGPMAQDFKAAFPEIGEDDKYIGAGDGIGVALAAIKGLHELVQEKDARIATLESKLASLEGQLNTSLAALDRLSDQVAKNSGKVGVSAALQ